MSPRRILVTGAEGFVGRHLLAALRGAFGDAHVTAAIREGGAAIADADSVVAFELLSRDSVVGLLEAARPDACVHLAAFSDVGASFADPDAAWAVNVNGTRLLAGALLAILPRCVLLHVGSADIYGRSFEGGAVLDEGALPRPVNPYAASKAAVDLALGEMALRGLHVIRMRPSNHVGPGQSERFAVAAFARQIARIGAGVQAPVIRTGSLEASREFLDVRDVCGAYVAVLRAAEAVAPGAVFNVTSEVPRTMESVLADLLRQAGLEGAVKVESSVLRPVDIRSARCSSAALRSRTGWAPACEWVGTVDDVLLDWRSRV